MSYMFEWSKRVYRRIGYLSCTDSDYPYGRIGGLVIIFPFVVLGDFSMFPVRTTGKLVSLWGSRGYRAAVIKARTQLR